MSRIIHTAAFMTIVLMVSAVISAMTTSPYVS